MGIENINFNLLNLVVAFDPSAAETQETPNITYNQTGQVMLEGTAIIQFAQPANGDTPGERAQRSANALLQAIRQGKIKSYLFEIDEKHLTISADNIELARFYASDFSQNPAQAKIEFWQQAEAYYQSLLAAGLIDFEQEAQDLSQETYPDAFSQWFMPISIERQIRSFNIQRSTEEIEALQGYLTLLDPSQRSYGKRYPAKYFEALFEISATLRSLYLKGNTPQDIEQILQSLQSSIYEIEKSASTGNALSSIVGSLEIPHIGDIDQASNLLTASERVLKYILSSDMLLIGYKARAFRELAETKILMLQLADDLSPEQTLDMRREIQFYYLSTLELLKDQTLQVQLSETDFLNASLLEPIRTEISGDIYGQYVTYAAVDYRSAEGVRFEMAKCFVGMGKLFLHLSPEENATLSREDKTRRFGEAIAWFSFVAQDPENNFEEEGFNFYKIEALNNIGQAYHYLFGITHNPAYLTKARSSLQEAVRISEEARLLVTIPDWHHPQASWEIRNAYYQAKIALVTILLTEYQNSRQEATLIQAEQLLDQVFAEAENIPMKMDAIKIEIAKAHILLAKASSPSITFAQRNTYLDEASAYLSDARSDNTQAETQFGFLDQEIINTERRILTLRTRTMLFATAGAQREEEMIALALPLGREDLFRNGGYALDPDKVIDLLASGEISPEQLEQVLSAIATTGRSQLELKEYASAAEFFADFPELALIQAMDAESTTAFLPFFLSFDNYWDNALILFNALSQHYIENSHVSALENIISTAQDLIPRMERQEALYAPSLYYQHTFRISLAKSVSQANQLPADITYEDQIDSCMAAIDGLLSIGQQSLYPSEPDYSSVADALITVGDLYVRLKRPEQALPYYAAITPDGIYLEDESLPIAISMVEIELSLEANMEYGYITPGQMGKALSAWNDYVVPNAYLKTAYVLLSTDDLSLAHQYIDDAAAYLQGVNNPYLEAYLDLLYGKLCLAYLNLTHDDSYLTYAQENLELVSPEFTPLYAEALLGLIEIDIRKADHISTIEIMAGERELVADKLIIKTIRQKCDEAQATLAILRSQGYDIGLLELNLSISQLTLELSISPKTRRNFDNADRLIAKVERNLPYMPEPGRQILAFQLGLSKASLLTEKRRYSEAFVILSELEAQLSTITDIATQENWETSYLEADLYYQIAVYYAVKEGRGKDSENAYRYAELAYAACTRSSSRFTREFLPILIEQNTGISWDSMHN